MGKWTVACCSKRSWKTWRGRPDMADGPSVVERISIIFADQMRIDVPASDTNLLEHGLLDSLAVIELLTLIEGEFRITIAAEDLELDNFRSIEAISDFVQGRIGIARGRYSAAQ